MTIINCNDLPHRLSRLSLLDGDNFFCNKCEQRDEDPYKLFEMEENNRIEQSALLLGPSIQEVTSHPITLRILSVKIICKKCKEVVLNSKNDLYTQIREEKQS